jgi:hypothetical protein
MPLESRWVAATMHGVPMHGSVFVPEGNLVQTSIDGRDVLFFHQRVSVRGRRRRPHGRPRNVRRRMKAKIVLYRPDFDKIKEQLDAVA